jgi:hypothetical protein
LKVERWLENFLRRGDRVRAVASLPLAPAAERRLNTLGIRRIMFAIDDIDAVVARMLAHGAELIGEMQYEDTFRLAYIRGPEGIIVALAGQLG